MANSLRIKIYASTLSVCVKMRYISIQKDFITKNFTLQMMHLGGNHKRNSLTFNPWKKNNLSQLYFISSNFVKNVLSLSFLVWTLFKVIDGWVNKNSYCFNPKLSLRCSRILWTPEPLTSNGCSSNIVDWWRLYEKINLKDV